MYYCPCCGEEWNHASEDCPSHTSLDHHGDLIDRVYDQVRDDKMLQDISSPEDPDY
jgi:hypothetical protein